MSTVPKRSMVASTAACALSGSAMSVFTKATRSLFSASPASSVAVRVPCSSPMSAIMTLAPSARNRRVYAVPIPLPPPVTIATLSCSRIAPPGSVRSLVIGHHEVGTLTRVVDRNRVGFRAVPAEHVERDVFEELPRHHALDAVCRLEHEPQADGPAVDALERDVAPVGVHESPYLVEPCGDRRIVHH